MTQISTVTGTISPEELGVISVHEHVKPVEGFRRESLDFQVRDLLRAKRWGFPPSWTSPRTGTWNF